MTRRTVGVSRIAIKELHSGSTEAPMRKPRRHGRHFAAGRRVVGKSWRAAKQTASGKRGRENVLGLAAAKAALQTEVGRAAAKVGKRGRENVLGLAAAKVEWGTGQRSGVVS